VGVALVLRFPTGRGYKKTGCLHSPGNFAGTETLGANLHLSVFATANIDLNALQIDKPPPPGMSI
jgi:hypothetical protein